MTEAVALAEAETVTVRLLVNGEERAVAVRPDETLLETLRGRFGLMSVRSTCDIGVCGVCTVLVEGRAVSGCLALTALQEGKAITTAEGLLDEAGRPDAVQTAFIAHGAFQCSYCTPAMVLATTALLAENPAPTDDEIRHYLAGNLCRCGSYSNVIEAIRALTQGATGARPGG